jgi:hypothetical protein
VVDIMMVAVVPPPVDLAQAEPAPSPPEFQP